jgi:hypothetical protein
MQNLAENKTPEQLLLESCVVPFLPKLLDQSALAGNAIVAQNDYPLCVGKTLCPILLCQLVVVHGIKAT